MRLDTLREGIKSKRDDGSSTRSNFCITSQRKIMIMKSVVENKDASSTAK